MPAEMLFMPTPSQTPSSSFQSDKTGSISSDPYSTTDPPGLSKGPEQQNFLTTLKEVSRDRDPSEKLRQLVSHAAGRSDKSGLQPENKPEIDLESTGDEAWMDIISVLLDDEASIKDQTPVSAELKELMALLEELGSNGSSVEPMLMPGAGLTMENTTNPAGKGRNPLEELGSNGSSVDPMLMPGAGLTMENTSNPAGKGRNPLVALKQLIGEIQPNDLKPDNDMSSGLERLRLFIANALAAGTAAPSGGNPQGGLNLNEPPGSVDLANWSKEIIQGQEKAVSINATLAEGGTGAEKSAENPSAMARPAMETDSVLKVPGSLKAVENSQIVVQSKNAEKTDAAPLAPLPPDMRTAAEANETVKETKVPEKVPGNGLLNNNEPEMPGKAGNSDRSLSSAGSGRPSGSQPLQENSLTGDSSPISKLINDAQVAKENPLKVDAAAGNDTGSKVVKIEAATHDNGQLNSQAQTSEKAPESVSSSKETEAGQRELRTRTLEQIVRRAVVQVREGRHEARIDLKPDFLGHVRMQVITENQQVTVKILTEFVFVKDMIDNNIQQLKADLQHQGLEVDKLDVSVSRDANGNKHPQENTQHARKLNREDNSGDRGDAREERERPTDRSGPRGQGVSIVDYFA